MNAVIFNKWFNNGDGLFMVGSQQDDTMHHRMFRLLLTDSGHYMLPTDHESTAKVAGQTKREAVLFCAKAASMSAEIWSDVHPRAHHCFLAEVGKHAAGDRSELFQHDLKLNLFQCQSSRDLIHCDSVQNLHNHNSLQNLLQCNSLWNLLQSNRLRNIPHCDSLEPQLHSLRLENPLNCNVLEKS